MSGGTIYVGDPHMGATFSRFGGEARLGINERGWLTIEVFRRACEIAVEYGCKRAVVLGDVIDNMGPPPQLLAAIKGILNEFDLKFLILKGNHDSNSDLPDDHALGVLAGDNVRVYDQPTLFGKTIIVPFKAGPIAVWLPEVLEELLKGVEDNKGRRVLCMHAGIKDDDTVPWLRDSPGAIHIDQLRELMETWGIHRVFAGDWHERRVMDGGRIVQVGALCPTGFQNLGISEYGNVFIHEADDSLREAYVHGPRFLQVDEDWYYEALQGSENKHFVEWTVGPDMYAEAQEKLRALIASGVVTNGTVLLNGKPKPKTDESGLAPVSEAMNKEAVIPRSVERFVDNLLVVDGVNKGAVISRTLRYLGE